MVIVNRRDTVRVPAAWLAVVLLGPGTRVTHAAVGLLADSGTAVCWVGEHGVRLYAAGIGPQRGAHLLQRQAFLVSRTKERLAVARAMYRKRFPDEDVSALTMHQLRGREGTRIRRLYQQHAQRTGIAWQGRHYTPGEPFATGDDLNRLLSAANATLYGICHAVITGLGASPGLGFVHTGSATSFVMDVADLYKADYTIPLAFDLAADGLTTERDARIALRDRITGTRLLTRIVNDLRELLAADDTEPVDRHELWDDHVGSVPAGTNYADDDHLAIIGPELDVPAADDEEPP